MAIINNRKNTTLINNKTFISNRGFSMKTVGIDDKVYDELLNYRNKKPNRRILLYGYVNE